MSEILQYIALDKIQPDPANPRRGGVSLPPDIFGDAFGDAAPGGFTGDSAIDHELPAGEDAGENVTSMTDSVLAHGVVQPILVQQVSKRPERYQIVAGERRWRSACAAKARIQAGKAQKTELRAGYDYSKIPAIIVAAGSDVDKLQVQLIENIQREGMSMRDVGEAFAVLRDKSGLSIRQLATRIGKSTAFVQNALCAASKDGQALSARLKSEDWHWVRRTLALQKKTPGVYAAILSRVKGGEPFSRAMYDDAIADDEALNDALDYEPAAAHAAAEEDYKPEDYRMTPEELAAFEAEQTAAAPVGQMRRAVLPSLLSRFTSFVEMGTEELMPAKESLQPPEPRVEISLSLPRSQAEMLAGLLARAARLGLTARAARGVSGADIVDRLKKLAGQ